MDSPARQSQTELYKTTLSLAYQSLGVVYGDLSTSTMYVYKSTFSGSLKLYEEDHEILGVLSLIIWTLTLIPLCKYIAIVLWADDNGEGGTFALYSLLCRHSSMGLFRSSQVGNQQGSLDDDDDTSNRENRNTSAIRHFFDKHKKSRVVLLLVVLLGTSMVIGDGILTPTMSVLSAVSGIKIRVPHLNEYITVSVACLIMVIIFSLQHYGTRRVGFLFAPILVAWLLCVGGVGLYNVIRWNPGVFRAVSPYYIYKFFRVTGKAGWTSLGGVVLCITGAEAMFADLGHFSQCSLRMAFAGFVYPCLLFAYMGEAAYLSKHREDLQSSFYRAIPEPIFWPIFIIATLASVVASQAIISATFSIISQCRALKCFPRVKIVHTSEDIHGRIYIPEVNWALMVLCLAVLLGFRDTDNIGNAYGLAAISVMFVTTCLMFLIITTVWKRNFIVALIFVVFFGSIELLYLSACLAKIHKGGWVPIASSLVILCLMVSWKYGTLQKQAYEKQSKVDLAIVVGQNPALMRVRGIGLIYSTVTSGAPPMFAHFVTNFPAFHEVIIFVTLETVLVPKVSVNERFFITQVGQLEHHIFRCTVRYGYKDLRDWHDFETIIIDRVVELLRHEEPEPQDDGGRRRVRFVGVGPSVDRAAKVVDARQVGITYMLGNTCVVCRDGSPFFKKFAINIYGFLRQNCRRPAVELRIPHISLIEVGMAYYV